MHSVTSVPLGVTTNPPKILRYCRVQESFHSSNYVRLMWDYVAMCEVSQVRLAASNTSGEDAQVDHSSVVARHSTRDLVES